jgi:hypothetical protein
MMMNNLKRRRQSNCQYSRNCGRCFNLANFSSIASQINVAIEGAVNTRIGDGKDKAESRQLSRLFRYWLAYEIREKSGIRWRLATEEHFFLMF